MLERCGIEEAKNKACPPSTKMVFIGVLFDTVKLTLEITPERLVEISALIETWLGKTEATKREPQSLIGKLSFISSCVRPGRVFIQRLLQFHRYIYKSDSQYHTLPEYLKMNLLWWHIFLSFYNGVYMMALAEWSQPDAVFPTDASLLGCGGICGNEYFHANFPLHISDLDLHINALELLTIVLALKLWGHRLKGLRIVVLCDNQSSCTVINRGSTRDDFMQKCLREICFLAATNEF